jgi:acetyltransferase-like isoleucine patch superfamily enzyme
MGKGGRMKKNIDCDELILGKNVIIEPTAVIRGLNGKAKKIVIGDNTYIGNDVQIICDELEIGDYTKIHHHTNIHGYKPCKIGHNVWIGQYCIIDTIGGTTIGNNCGIGAHSQLWSHMKYGDTLEGCRFLSQSELKIGNDVWFVGHCIVSPITAEDRSMALAGSVVTRNMEYNCIYAGTPAKNISSKMGPQFIENTVESKENIMRKHLQQFLSIEGIETKDIEIVLSSKEVNFEDDITYFDVSTRRYTKKHKIQEIKFMKFLLPEKAKFIPFE